MIFVDTGFFFALASEKDPDHSRAREGERLLSGRLARIHQASAAEERTAFEYLRKHRDKEYSAVDCLSFVVMDQLGISEALAVDEDFTHRFVARPGPRKA